jgi:hypothetical protein
MTTSVGGLSPGTVGGGDVARLQARMIGILYVVIAVLAAFAEFYVRGGMIVPGDASRTAANILANQQLYRSAGVADLIVLACDIAVAILLYTLLKPIGRTVALLAAAFRLSLVAVNGAAVVTHFAPVMLLRGDVGLEALSPGQLQALALFSLKLHSTAFSIAIVFFGIHCVLVGYLIYRSRFIPRIFGALWVLAGTIYVIHSMLDLLAVRLGSLADILLLVAGLSELSLAVWLLIAAVNPAKWQARTEVGSAA